MLWIAPSPPSVSGYKIQIVTKTAFIVLVLTCAAYARNRPRARDFCRVFKEIMATSDRGIPQDLLQKAECIVLVPGMKKGRVYRRRQLRTWIRFVP